MSSTQKLPQPPSTKGGWPVTVLIQCDNPDCAKTFKDDARHIALKVEGMPDMPVAYVDSDGEPVYEALALEMPGWFPHTHFCSPSCLASWAMAQHLDEEARWTQDGAV